jgi:hypothetical protein
MITSLENLDHAPHLLNYASAAPLPRERRSPLPWLALFSGILAWIPVFLTLVFGRDHALIVAPILAMLGLVTATISVLHSDPRSHGYHLVSVLSLISTFVAICVAIRGLLH